MQNELSNDGIDSNEGEVASVSWEASEYLQQEKNPTWIAIFVLLVVITGSVSYIILRDIFSIVIIALGATVFGIYAFKRPGTLSYQINEDGLSVSGRFYRYDQFVSFSVLDEGAIKGIVFNSRKRFVPPITAYYDPENELHIKEVLTKYLPYQQKQPDIIEKLFKLLRF